MRRATRMRYGESDWQGYSATRKRQELTARKGLFGGTDKLTADEFRDLMARPARKRHGQPERIEMERLGLMVMYGPRNDGPAWWAPHYERWEAATVQDGETLQRWREGAQPGWPDCGVFLPRVIAFVEMKAPDLKPKRVVADEWWLMPWAEGRQSRYGLREDQAKKLRHLALCGCKTMVAYSAEDAFWWLNDVALRSGES